MIPSPAANAGVSPGSVEAVVVAAWARVWSPLATPAERAEAWQALALPGELADVEAAFWSTFHAALPRPPVPLLLHAALGREGAQMREELSRVAGFLQLRWRDRVLPPDHLAAVCELLAAALENADEVLAGELRRRHLQPWCGMAHARLRDQGGTLLDVVDAFARDVDAARPCDARNPARAVPTRSAGC